MSKSIRGTTASHKSGGFDVISNFRGNNKALVPKKDSLLANLSLLCIVHSSCERRTRGQIIVEKLKDKGISMTNTMFVDTNNTYAREMHRNCLFVLGAKNGHVPHTDNIHEIVINFDKRIEKEAWNNGFRYFTDEKKDQDMLVVEYGPKPNMYLK